MEQINEFTVPEELDDERLDAVVASLSEGQSRSYLKNLIKDGSVLLNGKTAKPSARVRENDKITLVLPEKIIPDILPENIPLDILYEDEDVLVVNKPKGMVVHPAPGHYSGTLVNAVMYHCGSSLSGINGVMRPGIVHRIDRDTTGSVIICKNDAAHNSIFCHSLRQYSGRRIHSRRSHRKRSERPKENDCEKRRQESSDTLQSPQAVRTVHLCGMPARDRADSSDPCSYGPCASPAAGG